MRFFYVRVLKSSERFVLRAIASDIGIACVSGRLDQMGKEWFVIAVKGDISALELVKRLREIESEPFSVDIHTVISLEAGVAMSRQICLWMET